jgi:outer membrane protein
MPLDCRQPHLIYLIALSLALLGARASAAVVITLDQAYNRALASDQSVRKAYWEIRKANLEPLRALTRLGPSITGTGGLEGSGQTIRASGLQEVTQAAQSAFDAQLTQSAASNQSTHSQTGSLGLSYQQTILDLTAVPAFRLGKLTAQAAKLTYCWTVRQILFSLAQAYYEVLKDQRILLVARDSQSLAQQQLELAENRAAVGEVARADVLRAQESVESARESVIEADNTLISKRNVLSNILNLPTEQLLSVEEPAPYPPECNAFQALFARAVQRREDLRVKELAIQQDVQRREGVKAEYAPKIVAQLDADRNAISGSSSSRTSSWDAGLTVQVPFFTGGGREIDLAQANYQVVQTRLDYESFLKTVQQDVKDACLAQKTLEETLLAVRARLQAARQAYEDLRTEYKAGTATSVDVLSALNDLNTARRDLTTETYDYQVALRKVEQVTGAFQEKRVKNLRFK